MKYLTKLLNSCIFFCLDACVETDTFGFAVLWHSVSFWMYFCKNLQKKSKWNFRNSLYAWSTVISKSPSCYHKQRLSNHLPCSTNQLDRTIKSSLRPNTNITVKSSLQSFPLVASMIFYSISVFSSYEKTRCQ